MKIKINLSEKNTYSLMRSLGYRPLRNGSFVRPLRGSAFPRFHIYLESDKVLNLHLDQKAPLYKGARDHGGEYDGPLVEEESKRIKNYVQGS